MSASDQQRRRGRGKTGRIAPGRMALAGLICVALAARSPSAVAAGKGEKPASASKGSPRGGKSDDRAQAKAAVERAQIDYKLGRFGEALDGYRRAYELFQAPSLLFDIGQCHRNLGNPEKAIFFFEGYLREEPRIEPERRRLTENLIAEARADLQHKMALAATVNAPALASPPTPPPAPHPVQLQAMDTQRVIPAPLVTGSGAGADLRAQHEQGELPSGEHRSIASRWWFWTAIAGACVVAAGAAVYYATGEPRLVRPQGSLPTIDASSTMTMTSTSP